MIRSLVPHVVAFLSALALTLILTPLVREFNRRIGMVDKPDARRINKKPIPRGGGLAIVLGFNISYCAFHLISGYPWHDLVPDSVSYRIAALSVAMALIGLADDRFSLRPKLKLLGQLVVAVLAWAWGGIGFADLWPSIPVWLDCILTVFWILGAVNAFNLIDGLDGLATGLAFIAVVGMAGSLFFMHNAHATLVYFALAGAFLGFLRYNYHPASVFLGDCGSMFIGFVIAVLPFASHEPNSVLVSIGVPLLAMGVPIFDTSLAIIRRSLRRLLLNSGEGPEAGRSAEVMTADVDHLHHRILRATGFDQLKTAWILYAMALTAVGFGLVAMALKSRAGGVWLLAVALAGIVIFRDARIELFDAGRLLNEMAHSQDHDSRRRFAVFSVLFLVFFDILILCGAFFGCVLATEGRITEATVKMWLPLRVLTMFAALVFFRSYRTIWSRAVGSNYVRLFLGCIFGSVAGSVIAYYLPAFSPTKIVSITIVYALMAFVMLVAIRVLRAFVRDLFYALDCARIRNRKDVSRILVYGCGLRYRSFRRELVRSASTNNRLVVGFLDDDVYLRGRYVGGIKVFGTINQAPEVINELNVDAVVIACGFSDEWMTVVRKILDPTGVKITRFSFAETPIC